MTPSRTTAAHAGAQGEHPAAVHLSASNDGALLARLEDELADIATDRFHADRLASCGGERQRAACVQWLAELSREEQWVHKQRTALLRPDHDAA